MAMNAAAAYQNNKINTASPAELTLMLYEGSIKFCNIAKSAMEEKDIPKTNQNIIKAEKIVSYLRMTLDFKYPVAKDFDNIYDFIYDQLVAANIKKDITILEVALEQLRGMRDTWKEVMKHGQSNA
ncbi:MAG: flagellar protein FliS [Clostridiales bacterium]|jgi:flagellar protein FliS|nr:flagellar protein FliS [Clostridiales bacterium]